MSAPSKWVCDNGDGTFDHDWKWSHDFIGDCDVPNGTQSISIRVCRVCGVEDCDTPYEHEPLDDDVI